MVGQTRIIGNMIVAIIPAKGGSKGLPGKNMRDFRGKSLVKRAVESANIDEVDKICISTDSTDIITEISRLGIYKAEIFPRPLGLATARVEVDEVALFTFRQIEAAYGSRSVDTIIVLQPTSPLRTSNHVSMALTEYQITAKKVGRPLLSGYCSSKYHYKDAEREVIPVEHQPLFRLGREYLRDNTLFVENGAIYVCSGTYLSLFKTFRGNAMYPFEMDELESVEVDTDLDWKIAELYHEEIEDGNSS